MKSVHEIESNMAQAFGGSDTRYAMGFPFKHVYLSQGAKILMDDADCHWLMVVIASYIPRLIKAQEYFATARLNVDRKEGQTFNQAEFTLDDGNRGGTVYATQHIDTTDFPLAEIKLFVEFNGSDFMIMLPNEH